VALKVTDKAAIREAVLACPLLKYDHESEMISVTDSIQRNVLLLRKLPSEALPNKVQLWLGEKLGTLSANLQTITRELSNVWTLTFSSEEYAHAAWVALQDAS